MSYRIVNYVLDIPGMRNNKKLLLLYIARHADYWGKDSWPGDEKLAKYMSVSVKTIRRLLKELEDEAYIKIENEQYGRGNKRMFTVLIPQNVMYMHEMRRKSRIAAENKKILKAANGLDHLYDNDPLLDAEFPF
jgi:hypothetical protein